MRAANSLKIAFFGSGLASSYRNNAATYQRGIIKALAELGNQITFYAPDSFDGRKHRVMDDPEWANVVFPADESGTRAALLHASTADVIIKISDIGVVDEWLEREVLNIHGKPSRALRIFWDMDPSTRLERIKRNPYDAFRSLIPRYDIIFTYGGGRPVIDAYKELGARFCQPLYNALDPKTHYPVPTDPRYQATLAFLGNRLPDRDARVFEFFFQVAAAMPDAEFLLGGSGWDSHIPLFDNLNYCGQIHSQDRNTFHCSPLAVLDINRDSTAQCGFSPSQQVFEAAGAGACLIVDRWEGVEMFLKPGKEVLLASNGVEVMSHLRTLTPERATAIGGAARIRLLTEHTYTHRARHMQEIMAERSQIRETA